MEAQTKSTVETIEDIFAKIFKAAAATAAAETEISGDKEWSLVPNRLNLCVKSITDFGRIEPKTGFTLLHYACDCLNRETSLKVVASLFDCMDKYSHTEDQLVDVVNVKDSSGHTPLRIAIDRGYNKVVEYLLDNSADVTMLMQKNINELYHWIPIKIFDRGLKLKFDLDEDTNEYLWKIQCNFSSITGIKSKFDPPDDDHLETKMLSTILTLDSRKRHDILMHPLVQLFVQAKAKKYSNFIWASVIYHIIWYLISAIFMISTINSTVSNFRASNPQSTVETAYVKPTFVLANSTHYMMEFKNPIWIQFETGITDQPTYENDFKASIDQPIRFILKNDSNISVVNFEYQVKAVETVKIHLSQSGQNIYKINIQGSVEFEFRNKSIENNENNKGPSWLFYSIIIPLFTFSFFKEIVELYYSPSKPYYWSQYENRGQWVVLMVSFFSFFVPLIGEIQYWIPIFVSSSLIGEIQYWIQIFVSSLHTIGISSSLFLIQSQFTKTEPFGVYNLMMIKSFKKLLKFFIAFIPMLIAYWVVLNTLLPEDTGLTYSWGIGFGRILTMLIGELNYSDIFSADNPMTIPNIFPTLIVFILFILTIVILLQNLFIGLTVSNIEKLKTKAIVAHTATRLEVINLLERFLEFVMGSIGSATDRWPNRFFERILRWADYAVQKYSVVKQSEDNIDYGESNSEQCYLNNFSELPKGLQKIIRENKEKFITD